MNYNHSSFPYHLTNDNNNRIIQPFSTNLVNNSQRRIQLQELNQNKLQKFANLNQQNAIAKTSYNFQILLDQLEIPKTCDFFCWLCISIPCCLIPGLKKIAKLQNKQENDFQLWLNQSNQYLEQFGVQVFRRIIRIQNDTNTNNDPQYNAFNYLCYTLNQNETELIKNELFYTQIKTAKICGMEIKHATYRDDIHLGNQTYQSPQQVNLNNNNNYNQQISQQTQFQNEQNNYTYMQNNFAQGQPTMNNQNQIFI